MIISQFNEAAPGALNPSTSTGASFQGVSKLGGYGFSGPTGVGVMTVIAEHITIFDIVLKPDQGNGATVHAVAEIACP